MSKIILSKIQNVNILSSIEQSALQRGLTVDELNILKDELDQVDLLLNKRLREFIENYRIQPEDGADSNMDFDMSQKIKIGLYIPDNSTNSEYVYSEVTYNDLVKLSREDVLAGLIQDIDKARDILDRFCAFDIKEIYYNAINEITKE